MITLFGTSAPPFDLVKKNVKFMFMKMLLPPICPSPGACPTQPSPIIVF